MTNINKIQKAYDMRSHEVEEVEALFSHLMYGYTGLVVEKAKLHGITISKQTVRNVRHGSAKNLLIFNLILEVAREQKKLHESARQKFEELTTDL